MGKKKGKDKKGKGAEKTAQKTDRKAERKQKKELDKIGEDDIEKLIAEFQAKDKKQAEIVEVKCPPPTPRCNMSFTAHPTKEELIMFGGEYFNGKTTMLYNDLLFCNIKTREWSQVKSPNPPPPRCAHQAVTLPQDGGQLWIFGGEFASPSQSQFYHYKDLWVYSLRDRTWKKVTSPGGPSSRSGHRMVACKRFLFIFGGFHDNVRDYKYFNDLHAFSLETYSWVKLEISGIPPAPRSACVMAVSEDQNRVIVYGGYSKERIKRDVDKGKTHTDMVMLTVDGAGKKEAAPTKWRWQPVKQSGYRPSPRCGCTLVVTPGNRALVFGGVFDKEEDEEDIAGEFYNDLYSLELDRGKWFQVSLRGAKNAKSKKKRRKKKEEEEEAGDEDEGEEEMEEDMECLQVDEQTDSTTNPESESPNKQESMDVDSVPASEDLPMEKSNTGSVFSVTVASSTTSQDQSSTPTEESMALDVREPVVPGPRMNAVMAVKHGVLYMYGGVYEVGDKQYTLSDMYSLDLHKLDTWSTLIESNLDLQDWQESEESSEEEEDVEGAMGPEEMDDEDDDEDDDSDDEEEDDTPEIEPGQTFEDYFSKNELHWITRATSVAEAEGLQVSAKQIKKAANKMAKEFYTEECS